MHTTIRTWLLFLLLDIWGLLRAAFPVMLDIYHNRVLLHCSRSDTLPTGVSALITNQLFWKARGLLAHDLIQTLHDKLVPDCASPNGDRWPLTICYAQRHVLMMLASDGCQGGQRDCHHHLSTNTRHVDNGEKNHKNPLPGMRPGQLEHTNQVTHFAKHLDTNNSTNIAPELHFRCDTTLFSWKTHSLRGSGVSQFGLVGVRSAYTAFVQSPTCCMLL